MYCMYWYAIPLPGLSGGQPGQPQKRSGKVDLPAGAGEIQPPGHPGSHQQGESWLPQEGGWVADLPAGAKEIQPPRHPGSQLEQESYNPPRHPDSHQGEPWPPQGRRSRSWPPNRTRRDKNEKKLPGQKHCRAWPIVNLTLDSSTRKQSCHFLTEWNVPPSKEALSHHGTDQTCSIHILLKLPKYEPKLLILNLSSSGNHAACKTMWKNFFEVLCLIVPF